MSEVLAVKEIVLLNFLKALHITFSKLANSLLILVWDIYYQKVIGLSEYRRNTITSTAKVLVSCSDIYFETDIK